jgi:glycosyltransferase involved in cell wall biosynthesis
VLRIYNGVPKPIPSGTPEEIRTRWNLPLSKPLLIHVGRFSRQKNQPFLLDVIARLPETHLVLVGDGELRDELMTQIQQRHDLVSASDVFVFPSRFEAMSMVLLETMHLGIPIVASDIPANRDLLQSSAILLPIDGPERWVTEIGSLLGCRDSAAELGEKERSRVQRFTTNAMAASYRELLI